MIQPDNIDKLFLDAQQLCRQPILPDAQEQLDELRKHVPAEKLKSFDWYYEALFIAKGMQRIDE